MKKINKKLATVGLLSAVAAVSFTMGVNLLSAKAATEQTGSYYLVNGASVTILTGSKNESTSFSLDYTAVLDEAFYNANLEGNDYVLGVLIAPKQTEEITLSTDRVANICYVGSDTSISGVTAIPNFENGSYTFTASIIYNSNNIVNGYNEIVEPDETREEILQKAASLELTARPYYRVGDNDPVYLDSTVTRSIKNILNETNLRGPEATGITLPAEILNEFVGETTLVEGGDYYLDASTGDLLCYRNGELDYVTKAELGNVDSYVLSGKTVETAEEDTVQFDVADVPAATGKVRGITLVNSEATRNIKATVVTKVLRTQEDLVDLRFTGQYDSIANSSATLKNVDGYYLLGNDITFEWTGTWGSYWKAYTSNIGENYDYAFTGTFDGLGYTLSNFKATSGGMFGILRGATIKNVGFVDTTISYNKQDRMVLATHIQDNSLIENVYISLKDADENNIAAWWENETATGAILAGTSVKNSTFNNVVVDVPYEYTQVGNKKLGALPLFPQTTSNNTINNMYLVGQQPYKISRPDNGKVTLEFAGNITAGTGIELNKEYTISEVNAGTNDALKSIASIVTTVYVDAATSFVLADTLAGETVKQYQDFKDMSDGANDLTAFSSDYWSTYKGAVIWNSQADRLLALDVPVVWEGEFYVEANTGALLMADVKGDLQYVQKSALGTISNVLVGNTAVTLNAGDNVAFNVADLTSETLGNAVNIKFVGNGTKLVTATYITKALFTLSDLSVFNTSNNGYYVLAQDIVQETTTAEHEPGTSVTFSGTFDGRGRKVVNLLTPKGGVFGNLQGTSETAHAVVKNVAFIDVGFTWDGRGRGLFGVMIKYATLENVYVSYKGNLKHKAGEYGGILSDTANNNTFNQVIVVNNQPANEDVIGLFGYSNYANTFTNSYFISESAQMILKASNTTIQLIVGKNLNGDIEIAKEYTIADVLADGSAYSDEIKAIAGIAAKMASNSTTPNFTKFKVTYPGGSVNNKTHLITQYLSALDMKNAGNSYTAFTENNPYWTIVDGIPTWAR